jgi:hypothetical protein
MLYITVNVVEPVKLVDGSVAIMVVVPAVRPVARHCEPAVLDRPNQGIRRTQTSHHILKKTGIRILRLIVQ